MAYGEALLERIFLPVGNSQIEIGHGVNEL